MPKLKHEIASLRDKTCLFFGIKVNHVVFNSRSIAKSVECLFFYVSSRSQISTFPTRAIRHSIA